MDNTVRAIYSAVAMQSDESFGDGFAARLVHGEGLAGPVDREAHAALGRADFAVVTEAYG